MLKPLRMFQALGITVAMLITCLGCAGLAGAAGAAWTDITKEMPSLGAPAGIAVDKAGDLLVTDAGRNQVRELVHGAAWTDLTGNGGFADPCYIAVDASGNIYVSDAPGSEIIRIQELPKDATAWKDVTYNGDFVRQPDGLAVDGLAVDGFGNVYVADAAGNRIMELPNGATTWKDLTGQSKIEPQGLAVDNSGDVHVADGSSNRVRELASGSTTWSSDIAGYGHFDSLSLDAVDTAGNLYATGVSLAGRSVAARQIVELAPGSATCQDLTYDIAFDYIDGVTADGLGNVYATDIQNNQIKELPKGGTTWQEALPEESFYDPNGVAVDSSGDLYVADSGHRRIRKLPSGSATWQDITCDTGVKSELSGVAVDWTWWPERARK